MRHKCTMYRKLNYGPNNRDTVEIIDIDEDSYSKYVNIPDWNMWYIMLDDWL